MLLFLYMCVFRDALSSFVAFIKGTHRDNKLFMIICLHVFYQTRIGVFNDLFTNY